MSSVRARLDAQRDKPEEIVRPLSFSSTTRQAGTGLSVRQGAERRESLSSVEERLPRLDPHRATGLTSAHTFCDSVRGRLDRQRYAEEVAVTQPTTSAADDWLGYEEATKKRLADAQERRDREMQERVRNNEARAEYNRKIVPILLMFDSAPGGPATADERKRVLEAAQRKYSGLPTPEQAMGLLMVLRGGI